MVGRMARNAPAITCGPEDRQELERLALSRTESKQMVERAQIILGCLAGQRVKEVARTCHTRPNTVIKWRQRFAQHGLPGLRDAPRPGAKPLYGEDFRNRVLALLETRPPPGQASWDGPAVATALKGSVHAVWRVLRHEGICLQRQRSWCVSTDKEFAAKAADIVGLYLNPPEKALVISVDEAASATLALAENIEREDLSDFEIGESIRRLEEHFPKRTRLAESLGIQRSDLYRYLSFAELPDQIKTRLAINPKLLSRSAASDIVKVLKDTGMDATISARIAEGLSLLEQGRLDQTRFAHYLLTPTVVPSSSRRSRPTHLMKQGARVGSFLRGPDEVVMKISSGALSDEQVERLQRFVLELLQ